MIKRGQQLEVLRGYLKFDVRWQRGFSGYLQVQYWKHIVESSNFFQEYKNVCIACTNDWVVVISDNCMHQLEMRL